MDCVPCTCDDLKNLKISDAWILIINCIWRTIQWHGMTACGVFGPWQNIAVIEEGRSWSSSGAPPSFARCVAGRSSLRMATAGPLWVDCPRRACRTRGLSTYLQHYTIFLCSYTYPYVFSCAWHSGARLKPLLRIHRWGWNCLCEGSRSSMWPLLPLQLHFGNVAAWTHAFVLRRPRKSPSAWLMLSTSHNPHLMQDLRSWPLYIA